MSVFPPDPNPYPYIHLHLVSSSSYFLHYPPLRVFFKAFSICIELSGNGNSNDNDGYDVGDYVVPLFTC